MRVLAAAILVISAGLLSCTSGSKPGLEAVERDEVSGPASGPPVLAPTAGFALPAPSTLAGKLHLPGPLKDTRFLPADLLKEAEDFDLGLPNQRVAATASGARFNPDYPPGADFAGLSFAMYHYVLDGYAGAAELHYRWITPPPAAADAYIGLADWSADTWDWYPGGAPSPLSLPGLTDYLDLGGDMLVVVLCVGTGEGELDWLSLGSSPPDAVLNAGIRDGLTPLIVNFDASASTDSDGAIAEYRWDPHGDGSFDVSTGTDPQFSFEYIGPGSFAAAVRVFDEAGLSRDAALEINAVDTINFSYGAPDMGEMPAAMAVLPDNHIVILGSQEDFVNDDDFPFVIKVSPAGKADFATAWPHLGGFNDATVGPDGNLLACGYVDRESSGDDALLQEWSPDGVLLWSKSIGTVDGHESFSALQVTSDAIYACGNQSLTVGTTNFGLLARFDLDGTLVWAKSMAGPSHILFTDVAVMPLPPDAPSLQLAGVYMPDPTTLDMLYAAYDLDGNLQSSLKWNVSGSDERGIAIAATSNVAEPAHIVGYSQLQNGNVFTVLAKPIVLAQPGGTTLSITSPGSTRLLPTSLTDSNLALTISGVDGESVVLASYDPLNFIPNNVKGLIGISAGTGGVIVDRDLASFGDIGLLTCGIRAGALPEVATKELSTEISPHMWVAVTPPPSAAPQLTVLDTPVDTVDLAGLAFNRIADDGDPYLFLYQK